MKLNALQLLRIHFLGYWLVALTLTTPVTVLSEPLDATINYTVSMGGPNGIKIGDLTMTLTQKAQLFELTAQAVPSKLIFGQGYSSMYSRFEKTQNGYRSHAFRYTEGKDADEIITLANFDWTQQQVRISRKGKNSEYPLQTDTVDRLSIYLLIADRLRDGAKCIEIPLQFRASLTQAEYCVEATESLDLNGETIDAIRVRQVSDSDSRYEVLWYSPKSHPLPTRIDQYRKGERRASLLHQW